MADSNTEKWGESVNGIIKILENITISQGEVNYFDSDLNQSIIDIEKFISQYVPKEKLEIEDSK